MTKHDNWAAASKVTKIHSKIRDHQKWILAAVALVVSLLSADAINCLEDETNELKMCSAFAFRVIRSDIIEQIAETEGVYCKF